jgi:hypothetical protein
MFLMREACNAFAGMITPDGPHRRAWELPGSLIRKGLNDVELIIKSGNPLNLFWIEMGERGPREYPAVGD